MLKSWGITQCEVRDARIYIDAVTTLKFVEMIALRICIIAYVVALSNSEELYNEKYRPQLSYSPPTGWMNDPNGLVYHNGLFHLFYQHTPNSTVFGPIHWGHAVSSDLIHWETLPIAISPSQGNYIFSGSAIMDQNNVTGLQEPNNPNKPLIAIYTAHATAFTEEKQWLSYSTDGPKYKKFKFYPKNPIIPNPNPQLYKDIRDPQVFKYQNKYVVVLAVYNRTMIYNSPDLLKWTLVSEFGEHDGSHRQVWECPSLFPINVTINGNKVEKWVMIISLGPDQQYFVGSFDGQTFTNDNPKETELWVDYGPDSYAGVTYNLLPDGRRIFISWMNRWEYAVSLNFSVWNGQMGIPRELKLFDVGNKTLRLASLPVKEFEQLRTKQISLIENRDLSTNLQIPVPPVEGKRLLDIEMAFDLTQYKDNDTIGVELMGSKNKLSILFTGKEFVLDRSQSGKTDFNGKFGVVWKAPRHVDGPSLPMRIIIDRSSIQFFADDGLTVFAGLYYSEEDLASKINIYHHSSQKDSTVTLAMLKVHHLSSIWRSPKSED